MEREIKISGIILASIMCSIFFMSHAAEKKSSAAAEQITFSTSSVPISSVQTGITISAKIGGQEVGSINISVNNRIKAAIIEKLTVKLAYRYKKGSKENRHIGSELLKQAVDILKKNEISNITAVAEPQDTNRTSPLYPETLKSLIRFYEHNGFELIQKNFSHGDNMIISAAMRYKTDNPKKRKN